MSTPTVATSAPGPLSSNWLDRLRVRLKNLKHWRTAWACRHLERSMQRDPEFAYSWKCNIACPLMDEGMNHTDANKAADRLMGHLFGVKPTKL